MSVDDIFDNKVKICHTVEYYEEMDIAEYNLRLAANLLSADELKKVINYINRLTKKRLPLCNNGFTLKSKKRHYRGREICTL